ncbi:MAG: type II secretion system secretin GspD [Burkholderiales bacterium]|nr:type II secretion system secretin GspD [Burkholderiales bacterium]
MTPHHRLVLRRVTASLLALSLVACQTPPPRMPGEPYQVTPVERSMTPGSPALSPAMEEATSRVGSAPPSNAHLYKGTGIVVRGQQPGGGVPPPAVTPVAGGAMVLNFEGADLREVVRTVLGEVLNETYTIDPAVGGTITLRTSSGIPRDALPATLETLLRMNGATMVKSGGMYMIVPQAAAVRGNVTPQLGSSSRALPAGFSVQIVPLKYVGVREMLRILEPFARDAQAVRVDELRNMLILAGTERELRHLMDTIDMFDIDWMAGMSAGVFTLQNSDVKDVMKELEKVVGDRNTSPLTGILKIVPIERMNALLVVTPQPSYLEEVKKWIERLDRRGDVGGGLQFYVYNLQNTRAERLGPLLQQAFTGRAAQPASGSTPTLAPGTPAGSIVNPPQFQPQPGGVPVANPTPASTPAAASSPAAAAGQGTGIVRNLQVVADKDANTLLFVATAAEYAVIEQALRKLDVPQRQVVIDVTIAQILLTDQLDFGVEWLFRGGAPSGRGSGGMVLGGNRSIINPATPTNSALPQATDTPSAALVKGFTYIINNTNFPGGIQAALNLLDTYGTTKIVANPQVAALDNQKATIKSGERIPINQSTIVGGTTNAVTTTAQYVDTGVLLQVTPHINAGGLVALEVQAEVSDPGVPACTDCAPPINTRSIQTYVSVPSGQTMVMGGLINEGRQNASEGLPLLSRIPILGGLFGQQMLKNNRTELILFITPRVVENQVDIAAVVHEMRRRMENLDAVVPIIRPYIGPIFPDTEVNPALAPLTSPPLLPPPPGSAVQPVLPRAPGAPADGARAAPPSSTVQSPALAAPAPAPQPGAARP